MMEDHTGEQFGNYRLTRLLGQGGFAQVYLGEHIHLQIRAAVKVLTNRLGPKDEERFLREAKLVASFQHLHIVHVFDCGVEQGLPFLIMNYAARGTVQRLHGQELYLPLETVVNYVQQMSGV